MQTRDITGNELSNEVFEEKAEMLESFDRALDNKEVKTIEVTKDIKPNNVISEERRNYVNKKVRKLHRKLAEYQNELK